VNADELKIVNRVEELEEDAISITDSIFGQDDKRNIERELDERQDLLDYVDNHEALKGNNATFPVSI
jgi:hypothetical protein